MNHAFVLIALSVFSLACERIPSTDGTVPAEYLEVARKYEGSYSGKFEGVKGTLTLKLEENRPVVSFVAVNGGSDILGGNCDATISELKAIIPEKNNNEVRVDEAEFAFSAGRCNVAGDILVMDFKHNGNTPNKVSLSMLAGYETYWRTVCYPDGHGRQHCHREHETVPVYYEGSFRKN